MYEEKNRLKVEKYVKLLLENGRYFINAAGDEAVS
jgi:hypothetical protein